MAELLQTFEIYLHDDKTLPPLVRTALLHLQFETIHPYLGGNGRIGRLLITLLLEQYGLLSKPLLYLSLYFKRYQDEYYRLLGAVRHDGDWESWIRFFLEGVATIANEAADSARDLFTLLSDDRQRVLYAPSSTLMAARLLEQLPEHPVVTISQVTKLLGTTKPTANKAVGVLVDADVLTETSGRKRGQMFAYTKYLDRLRADTEL